MTRNISRGDKDELTGSIASSPCLSAFLTGLVFRGRGHDKIPRMLLDISQRPFTVRRRPPVWAWVVELITPTACRLISTGFVEPLTRLKASLFSGASRC